jgi:hypothetical protein
VPQIHGNLRHILPGEPFPLDNTGLRGRSAPQKRRKTPQIDEDRRPDPVPAPQIQVKTPRILRRPKLADGNLPQIAGVLRHIFWGE